MGFPPTFRQGHETSRVAYEHMEGTGKAGTVRRLVYECIADAGALGITRTQMFYDDRFRYIPIRTRNQSIASAAWGLKKYQGPGAPLVIDGPDERRRAAVMRLAR